ncbi:MAG: Endo,4-beta-xylanase precursor [Labilithrix sp.]|nr:Endo,4-beta-xylanase precursor [Labilithrix sp.]
MRGALWIAACGALVTGCSADATGTKSTRLTGPTVHHVLSTGQSNSIGFAAHSVLSSEQPFTNLMFDTGVIPATSCDDDGCHEYEAPRSLVPLVEGDHYFDEPVETMSAGLANEIGLLAHEHVRHDVLVTVHGRSGNTYECLRKGGCAFQDGKGYVKAFDEAVREMKDAHRLANAAGRPYVVRAVTAIHGESDHYDKSFPLDGTDGRKGAIRDYADALVEWQRDYETAVHDETGQTDDIPFLISQMANWNDRPDSDIPVLQLEAHDRAPGKVVLIGATYMLPFASDCIHYTSQGERRLGEYFAKAYSKIVIDKETWEPLRPTSVKLSGATINVRFHVPAPPLVFDTTQVTDPGSYGFDYVDDGPDTPVVQSVDLDGEDAIAITLSAPPTAANRHLRYALRATPETCPGPKSGPRGNLRDSDMTPSQDGADLANWAVSFDVPIE